MSSESTFLVELGCEELPPFALEPLSRAFADSLKANLAAADIAHGDVHAFATPRRLAVKIEKLASQQPDRDVERLGPAVAAAFRDGKPTKAAEGFASSLGVTVDDLMTIETDKGPRIGYRSQRKGEATTTLLPQMIEQAIAGLPVPKYMRWGASRTAFSRPVHWLVALYGTEVVPATALELTSGRTTLGHRIHCEAPIELANADEYETVLEQKGYVIADAARRSAIIRQQVETEAQQTGGHAVIDDDLLQEVTGLVEWPVALTGSFDERFLEVPQECLISSMKANQKYFHLLDANGQLLPKFITIANLESRDPAQVVAGNERVIRPRLADAAFFFETDRRSTLDSRRAGLEDVVFQRRLGTLADKSRRIEVVAAEIANRIGGEPTHARRAAQLAKCDLNTEMVLEFPELQGIMGTYYAREDGEPADVAEAIQQQYLPRFAQDSIPSSKTGVALALADRLDTLTGIFGIGQRPTGAKDPFALRRATIGVLNIIIKGEYDLDLRELLQIAVDQHTSLDGDNNAVLVNDVLDYMLERLRGWAADEGISAEVYQSVRARNVTRPLDFARRLQAVKAFNEREEARALAAANKRVGNILAKLEGGVPTTNVDPTLFEHKAEQALLDALTVLEAETAPMFAEARYNEALDRLATLREPVDAFFEDVMVMAEDEKIRNNRLALLARLHALFLAVADISLL
ncbi:glycine--tRNA ligase subunit beta [Zymobacter palmae]|uniref:Glycine--tRNA ligase beta subunit n=1 Tax=Zymobacter palmae TaxID=33074 RepID=A0A348HB94_9GAMM|nr:glycine--tRNA ligase subunit beta [Zymobacter palmae]BBG28896.1 glycyl-tRNA synthetase, beta subunit [Zymobacter palmae]